MTTKSRTSSVAQLQLKDNPSKADLKKTKSPVARLIEKFQ